jgi:hypothetical protein
VTWFKTLTGCREESPEYVREHLAVDGDDLRSNLNGKTWCFGKLETPTLAQLRARAQQTTIAAANATVRELVADVRKLHCDAANAGAMFQVASQFNLLEMTSPMVMPEDGVGIYENDCTQGPACAIAAGAGTIYRNYFVTVNGQRGQLVDNQIDCLADLGRRLGNSDQRLWAMTNGYALPSHEGLSEVNRQLVAMDESELDALRGLLRIGLQLHTQVTLHDCSHKVSQAYCSAMPVAYTRHSRELWAPLATLVLQAAYEATICASIENAACTGNNRLYLTLLGGGAFRNDMTWILDAIQRAVSMYSDCGLDIAIVSHGQSKPAVQKLVRTLNAAIRNRTSS